MEEAVAEESAERHGKDYSPWEGKHSKRVGLVCTMYVYAAIRVFQSVGL